MKRNLLSLILVIMLCLTALVSCNLGIGPGQTETPGDEVENLIYNSSSALYFILGEGADEGMALNLQSVIDGTRGKLSDFASAASEPHDHEIVIGNTDRAVTKRALERLDRLEKEEGDLAYLIYSDGASVAIVFDEDERDVAETAAIEYFEKHYVLSELVLKSGVAYSEYFNIIDYYRELDDEAREEEWAALKNALDPSIADEFVTAMRQLYAIYSPDVVTWLANLYEPNICVCYGLYSETECKGTKYCGTAGIYYSNSGRDTVGYLPDVESMSQALGFIQSAGMCYMFNNSYSAWLPEEMKLKMGLYAQALQDPDGFFYHPQWGKDYIINNNKDSRRSRDLGHATGLLNLAGLKPHYTTPTGVAGSEDSLMSSIVTTPLGNSSVSAVSKVILVANDNYAAHLESVKTFTEYLLGYDIRNNSYSVGNRIGSQIGQIQARDKVIGTEDDPTPLMDVLMDYLITNQNPETGCWNWQYVYKGIEHTGGQLYESVNGLLKIGGQFTSAGVKMPYAKEAAITAMEAITDPKEIDAVTDLYNTWYAIENIIENLRRCGGLEGNAEADEIIDILLEMSIEGIRASITKISAFMKMDGSFSYAPHTSATTSQGCPVALPETDEGDVNATTISINGIRNHILGALELDRFKPILFGEAERLIYLDIINNANSVKKNEVVLKGEPLTFDFDDIGVPSEELVYDHGTGKGSANVVANPKGEGNAVKIVSYNGNGDYITIPNQSNSALDNTFVFETDFLLESTSFTDGSYFIQVFMGRNNYTCYFFTLRLEGDSIIASEQSSTNWSTSVTETLGEVGKLGEWFRIKVEYYYSQSMDEVRIKFHYDDDLTDGEQYKVLAVTDNFYDASGNKYLIGSATPCKYYEYTKLYMMKDGDTVLYMDNCMAYKSKIAYTQETDPNNQPAINVDPPDSPEKIYGFEGDTLDSDITAVPGTGEINLADGALNIVANGSKNGPSVNLPVNVLTKGSQCVNVSMDILCSSAKNNSSLVRLLAKDGGLDMFGIDIVCKTDSQGNKYLTLCEYSGKAAGKLLDNVRIPVGAAESVNLSFDYFHREDMIIVYLDGEFVAATSMMYENGIKYSMDNFSITTLADAEFELAVDNLKVERNTYLFADAVAPNTPSAPHTFDAADSTIKTTGAVSVSGGELVLNAQNNSASATVSVHTRANLQNMVRFAASIRISNAKKGETHRILFKDSNGAVVFALALVNDGTNINLCQVSEGGTVEEPIYSYSAKNTISFELLIYQDNKMVHILENGIVKSKTSVFYTPENRNLKIATATITSSAAASLAAIDDLLLEEYYGAYKNATISAKTQPNESIKTGFHFELSNSGKIPTTNLEIKLSSPAAAVRVERIINTLMTENNKNGEWSNVLAFDTGKGANDSLIVSTPESVGAFSSVAFEADLMVEKEGGGAMYQIYFADKSRNNKVYMISLDVNDKGKISLSDMSSNSWKDSISNSIPCDLSVGELFNLRVELYKGTRDTVRFKVYINGAVVMVSDNFYHSQVETATPNSLVETVQIMSLSDAEGTLYLDNISFTCSNATCNDPVTSTK